MKTINIEQLNAYTKVQEKSLSTTEIMKDSFKNAFKTQDKEGYIIVKNNRRKRDSIMLDITVYLELIKRLELLEEKNFDIKASKLNPDNYEYTNAKDLDL